MCIISGRGLKMRTRGSKVNNNYLSLSAFQGNIPSCLCTSPIPLEESPEHTAGSSQEPGVSKLSLSGETETSTSNMTLRKKRRRKKKPKRKEAADSTPEEQEGTESERSLEEKHKQLTPS